MRYAIIIQRNFKICDYDICLMLIVADEIYRMNTLGGGYRMPLAYRVKIPNILYLFSAET